MRIHEIISEVKTPKSTACPPATQDITLNLENRQKAINEYGYGPLNPDLPNTKFWMKKVNEWNLDSAEEAKQSLCGNCAAFDLRQDTLNCIAKGIGSEQGVEDPTIEAGDLGYCRFLKFKCAAKRTCDAWVTGGPLVDQQDVEEAWSQKYKKSINCSHPKGFSQKAHCAGKKKHNESTEMEMVCEDCGMCQTHGNLHEIKKGQKDSNGYTKCWPGYHADGTKKSNTTGKQVRNCVPNESLEETYHGDEFFEAYGEMWYNEDDQLDEAEYQGRKVPLGKPMQGDVKKFKVYVKDPSTGNIKKVNFGDPNMRIKKSNPARRKSFRARHNCANPGPRTKARYWSCRAW